MKKTGMVITTLVIVSLLCIAFFYYKNSIRFSEISEVINCPIGAPNEFPSQFVFSEDSNGTKAVYLYSPWEVVMFNTYTLNKKIIKYTNYPCRFCLPVYPSNKIYVSKNLFVYFVWNNPSNNTGELIKLEPRRLNKTTIFEAKNEFINDFAMSGNNIIIVAGSSAYISQNTGKSFSKIDFNGLSDISVSAPFLNCGITGEYSYIGGCNGRFAISKDFFKKNVVLCDNTVGFYQFVNRLIFIKKEKSGNADFLLMSNPLSYGNQHVNLHPCVETVSINFDNASNNKKKTEIINKFVLPESVLRIRDIALYEKFVFIATNNGIFYTSLDNHKFKKVPGISGNIESLFVEKDGTIFFDEYDTKNPGIYYIKIINIKH